MEFGGWLLGFVSDRGMENDRYRDLAELCAKQHERLVELAVGLTPDVSQRCAQKGLDDDKAFMDKYDGGN